MHEQIAKISNIEIALITTDTMRILSRSVTCVCTLALLVGCATQPIAPAVTILHPASRLQVLQLPPSVTNNSLRRLFHAGAKENISAQTFTADRQHVAQLVDGALRQALTQAQEAPLTTAAVTSLDDAQGLTIGQPVSSADLAALQAKYPADAYLRIQVTDYGQTPQSWEGAYVGFEVVTTLAIGAWLYVHTATRVLTAPYLVEESVEEFSEGYAGFWLLNRMSRPVRIDADLVDGKTGKVLWHDAETGLADWHWANVWHMNAPTQDQLLEISTDHAMKDLVNELQSK